MLKELIDGFKRWMTSDKVSEAYDILISTSKTCDRLCAEIENLVSRIKQLEVAEKSRKDALESMVSIEGIETNTLKCDDCISMRLEMDSLKARLEALETAQKNGSGGNSGQANNMYAVSAIDKPKLRRRKGDAKELAS